MMIKYIQVYFMLVCVTITCDDLYPITCVSLVTSFCNDLYLINTSALFVTISHAVIYPIA